MQRLECRGRAKRRATRCVAERRAGISRRSPVRGRRSARAKERIHVQRPRARTGQSTARIGQPTTNTCTDVRPNNAMGASPKANQAVAAYSVASKQKRAAKARFL